MQTIGLVGGMSSESTAGYYRDLVTGVRERKGGLSSPKLVLSTVDFAELTELEGEQRWDQIGALLAEAAQGVERAGADFLLLCTTTFHKVADQVAAAVDIPLLHLADVAAEACLAANQTSVGLIGTKVAMIDPFFRDRMATHGLEVLVFLFCGFRPRRIEPAERGKGTGPFIVSWEDAGESFLYGLRAAQMPSPYETFFICAKTPDRKHRVDKAKRLLGWEAKDTFEELLRKPPGP